jgi:hypothetical protein
MSSVGASPDSVTIMIGTPNPTTTVINQPAGANKPVVVVVVVGEGSFGRVPKDVHRQILSFLDAKTLTRSFHVYLTNGLLLLIIPLYATVAITHVHVHVHVHASLTLQFIVLMIHLIVMGSIVAIGF